MTKGDPRRGAEDPGRHARRTLFGIEVRWQGESLIGAVRRCAEENWLPSASDMIADACRGHHPTSNLAARTDLDASRLAWAMRVPVAEVERRLHRTVATVGTTRLIDFFGASVPACRLALGTRSIATEALCREHYHRALWQHALVPFDRRTGELLIDRCPYCQLRLGWSGGGVLASCDSCGRRIEGAWSGRVTPDAIRQCDPMLSLIDPDRSAPMAAGSRLHPDLATLNRGIAFELGWRIAAAAGGRAATDRRRLGSAPEARIRLLGIGGDVVRGWPDAPRDLAREALRAGGAAASTFMTAFRAIATGRDAIPEHAALLRRAMPDMLAKTPEAARTLVPGGVCAGSAARILGTDSRMFGRCVANGGIEPLSTRGSANRHDTFDAATLAEARRLLDGSLPFGRAAERFGVPLAAIERLVAVGLLEQIRHPVVVAMRKDRMLSRSFFDDLIGRLWSGAATQIEKPTPLRTALKHVGGRPKPWAALFDAMLSGGLPFRLMPAASQSSRLIDRIEIPSAMASLLAHMPEPLAIVDVHISPTMPRRDAEWILNLNPKTLSIALHAELSSAIDAGGDLIVEEVLALARKRIGGGEVAVRFMAGSRRLPDVLRVGGLPRLGATGWDRVAVEEALA